MPYVTKIDCPRCDEPLVRKTGGRCPNCGEVVAKHVAKARLREKRVEQIVAILGTFAMLGVFLWGGGAGLVEGVVIYALAGLGVWYWSKGTFWSDTLRPEDDETPDDKIPDEENPKDGPAS